MLLKFVRTIVVAFFVLFPFYGLYAQDVEPMIGGARKVADNAASFIDYSTGVMNYSIPFFTTGQDGYKIPLTVSYSAGGIKVDDKPGIYGLGWQLNYGGGIISRTIRGSYADEEYLAGMLKNPIPDNPPDSVIHKINVGATDGESDIFTLQVNGILVHFFLQASGDTCIVKTLEKTNVKIHCLMNLRRFENPITGWSVIDEQGNSYQFMATSVNIANVYNGVNTNGVRQGYAANWYLTTVSCVNNDNITFEYLPNDFVEIRNDEGVTYTRYSKPLQINDYDAINASLGALADALSDNVAAQDIIKKTIALYQVRKSAMEDMYVRNKAIASTFSDSVSKALNYQLTNQYLAEMSQLDRQIEAAGYDMVNLRASVTPYIQAVVAAYGLTKEKVEEFKDFGQFNLYSQKLIKRITLRNTAIEFDYAITNYSFKKEVVFSGIRLMTLAGDTLKKVLFSINDTGYLKNISTYSAINTQQKKYTFTYFDDDTTLSHFAQDYWGYYNGKPNESLLPYDPVYLSYTPAYNGWPFFGPMVSPNYTYYENTTHPPGDRYPDVDLSKARSLKSVTDHLGATTSFDYEGNDVYLSVTDKNVLTGGIRIKSLVTEDAFGQIRKVKYKYRFPLSDNPAVIRSTGQLAQWTTKAFTDIHPHYQGSDVFVYSNMIYRGINCLPIGANDVLYSYVEEQEEDNSATGYKFFGLNPPSDDQPHNSLLDGKLMAQVNYDATGKIVDVRKYQYGTNYTEYSDRSDEISALNQVATPCILYSGSASVLSNQYRKSSIFYDPDDIIKRFNGNDLEVVNLAGELVFVPSTGKLFYDNYSPRFGGTAGRDYQQTYDIFVRPTSSIVYTFSDYSSSDLVPSISGIDTREKGYQYERLLAGSAHRIQQAARYYYESAETQLPTRIESTDSKGNVRAAKYKYAADYAAGVSPFIDQLKAAGRGSEVIETQQWISTDNGNTFKIMTGEVNLFSEKAFGDRKYILPLEKRVFLPVQPADFPGQSVTATGPYNTIFWENGVYYKHEQAYSWQVNDRFARMNGQTDRTDHYTSTTCYDSITGNLLIKTAGIDPSAIAATDIGPFIAHDKYALKGWFKNKIPIADPKVYTYDDRPFTNGLNGEYFDWQAYAPGISHQFYDIWYPQQGTYIPEELIFNPFLNSIVYLFEGIANKTDRNGFLFLMEQMRKEMAAAESTDFMSQALTYLVPEFFEIFSALQTLDGLYYSDVDRYESEVLKVAFHIKQPYTTPLNVERARAISNKLDLYLVKGEGAYSGTIGYSIKYRNGTTSPVYQVTPQLLNERIARATLDLTTITNAADAVEIKFVSSWSVYAVPQGIPFEGYAYLPDNQLLLAFNQTGRYRENLYDEYGDVVQTTDNKNIATANAISYEGKGTPIPREDLIPFRIVNNNDYHYTGAAATSISLRIGASNTGPIVVDSKQLLLPGQDRIFYIKRGKYFLTIKLDAPFSKVIINGQVITPGSVGQMELDPFVDVSNANGLEVIITEP